VFPAMRGRSGHMVKYHHRFKEALELAGLPTDRVPYSMRHTCATNLAARGVPGVVIQRKLGHASIATTNVYLHTTDAAEQATAEVLGQIGEGIFAPGSHPRGTARRPSSRVSASEGEVSRVGLEPTANGLKVRCSTT
jgi:hypothetical protein